ncbi:HNH endonuclease [Salinicoccus sp. HZC-1]|uniref:HNH endonuclease n=1 Tax=Salinicoccus sp. HZC-1 TaxID=3385497 RepID=UPI00398B02EA
MMVRHKQEYDWFYQKKAWKLTRAKALARDNYTCQKCMERGDIKSAELVHHIVYVEEDIQKALQLDNLISLCHTCHNNIHKHDNKRKSKPKTEKRNVRVIKI